MGEGLRHNILHVGDLVADNIERALDCVRSSTRGVSLTYDIHEAEKDKRKSHQKIGARVAEIRKTTPELEIFNDEKMMALFSTLSGLEERQEAHTREREERLNPGYETSEQ